MGGRIHKAVAEAVNQMNIQDCGARESLRLWKQQDQWTQDGGREGGCEGGRETSGAPDPMPVTPAKSQKFLLQLRIVGQEPPLNGQAGPHPSQGQTPHPTLDPLSCPDGTFNPSTFADLTWKGRWDWTYRLVN